MTAARDGLRVAVLADIHANLPALEAVLAEIHTTEPDRVVLAGDIAAGPLPNETLDLLETLGDRALWVRGNADRELVEAHDGTYRRRDHPADDLILWAGAQLTPQQRDRLAGLPLTVTLDVAGLGPTLFCHATARNDTEIVLVDSAVARFEQVFDGVDERVVVMGHTHMPFDRLAGRRYVNPGSVGMPYGHPGAAWALLGPHVELRRTVYDAEAAAAHVQAASRWSGAAEWAGSYVLSQPSDVEALGVFTELARSDR